MIVDFLIKKLKISRKAFRDAWEQQFINVLEYEPEYKDQELKEFELIDYETLLWRQ